MNLLQIKGLKKTYKNGVTPINNLNLEIGNGLFGLLGRNGAGKSSLMRTIATLQQPDEGEILFNAVNILEDPFFMRSQLGYLPQEFGVYPKISAFQLLDHLAVLKGITVTAERKEQVNHLLSQTNLYEHRHRAVHGFSGGMKQRFGIAQALLGSPKLIIVDEPTAGLDPEERNRFNNLLSEIGEQVIVILSTHLVEDVADLCSHMAIISGGSVITQGKPADLIDMLRGNIWSKTVDKLQLPAYQENMRVISTRLTGGKVSLHVLASTMPEAGFQPCEPTLEDFYFNALTALNKS